MDEQFCEFMNDEMMSRYFFLSMVLLAFCLSWKPYGAYGQHRQLLLEKGIQHYQQGQYLEASRHFQQLSHAGQAPKESYSYLTVCYLQLEEAEKAIISAKAGLEKFQKDMQLSWLLGEAYLMDEQPEAALSRFLDVQQQYMFGNATLPELLKPGKMKEKTGQTYRLLGARSFKQGELPQAASYFRHAQEYLPYERESYQNLAYVYAQLAKWDEAIEIADAGLAIFPDHTLLRQLKAQAYFKSGNYVGLLEEYEELYRQNPAEPEVAISYAEVLMANKKSQEAALVYEKLLRENPRDRKIYEALISLNEQFQNIRGKIKVLQHMKTHFPKDETLYRSLAQSFEQLEEWEGARQVYDSLLLVSKDQVWVRRQIVRTYLQQDSLQQALGIYQQLLWEDQAEDEDLIKAAEVAEKLGNWSEALGIYQLVEEATRPAYVKGRMGFVYEQLREQDLAEAFYEEAVYLQSDYPLPYFRLAAMKQDSSHDLSLCLAQTAFRLCLNKVSTLQNELKGLLSAKPGQLQNPAENKQLHQEMEAYEELSKGIIAFLSGQFPEREVSSFLDLVVQEYPASASLFYLLGNHYKIHRKYEEALGWYQKAVRKKPVLKEAHLAIASLYEKKEEEKQAMLAYERALSLDEQDRQAYRGLIRLYQQQGQLEQLWPKWMVRYRSAKQNAMLREHLVEALHKDGQYELARSIIEDK